MNEQSKIERINCIVCEEPIAIIRLPESGDRCIITVCDFAVCGDCFETKDIDYILTVVRDVGIT